MSKYVGLTFCELPKTPREFNMEKFKEKDMEQVRLYNMSKIPNKKKSLSYDDLKIDERSGPNYARIVPENCIFVDYDDSTEAAEMYDIIIRSKLKCLILETVKGYHFLFRKPDFYEKEMTKATNWFGYKFDTKGPGAVQIIKVCGMEREERASWELDELIAPASLDIDKLDILPYWLWGKLKDSDLHKGGKTGDRTKDDAVTHTLKDNPFTQLMTMTEGSRHNHIVERCSYFGLSNGFELTEFKDLILAIHDQYLIEIGTPMTYSDLFGDLEDRWDEYKGTLESSGYDYDEAKRKWIKVEKKKDEKIDERRAAEYIFNELDCYVTDRNKDGTYAKLLHRDKDGSYDYRDNSPERRQVLRVYSEQNFKDTFFKEVEVQLMQMCIENHKFIRRSHEYIIVKNKVLSCIAPLEYDFSWLGTKPPTDVVLPWSWYDEEWVKEHEEDLGGNITCFIKELARDARGISHPEVERWLYVVAGAAMIPANDLQKIVVLAGGGANGKSIFTSLIRFCLGDEMFNTAKIFDSNPQEGFWGATFDKGICCIVDDMPQYYNKAAFSYIKGAVTGSDPIEINEKFKPKKTIAILPQIIACTNHDFELYDKSEGMKRRVLILPTEYQIPVEKRDPLIQVKLVLNTTDDSEVSRYRMEHGGGSDDEGTLIIKMRTKEKGVLDSLREGSLAWFANKCRYEYLKASKEHFILDISDGMTERLEGTFAGGFDAEMEEFLEWYVTEKKEDIWTKELYLEYIDWHTEMATGEPLMKEKNFSMKLGKTIAKLNGNGHMLELKKTRNDKGMVLNKLFIKK